MKNIKKITACIVTAGLLSTAAIPSFAEAVTTGEAITTTENTQDEAVQPQSYYGSFTGIVKEIKTGENGQINASLDSEEGASAVFILTKDTYFMEDVKVEVGAKLTGFYEAGRPMIMIYPPQYSIDIIAPAVEGKSIKADWFDGDLLSQDQTLKLNISEETEILWENGTQINWFAKPTAADLAGALANRKLIVSYSFTTKSIPAQTSPEKVIVLSAQQEEPSTNPSSEYKITINGIALEAAQAYTAESGTLMVPVRAVAEALGYTVAWDEAPQKVSVNHQYAFVLGEDRYDISSSAWVSLGTPAELKDDLTYVPLSFFSEAMQTNKVSISGETIAIDLIQ